MIVIGNRESVLQIIAEAISLYKKKETQENIPQLIQPCLLTREEAAAFLKISKPTLAKYTKAGIVEGKMLGNRILYSKEDLISCGRSMTSIRFKLKDKNTSN